MTPLSHAFVGVHAAPGVHAPQVPLLQTSFVPHVAPFFAVLAPPATHTGVPVAHEIAPVAQTFAGVQAAPVVHAPHTPLSQTSLVPHIEPFAAVFAPPATHTGAPVAHEIVPVRHAFVGVHAAPAVQ